MNDTIVKHAGFSSDNVLDIAHRNLFVMSRTAHGIVDVSASATKADAMQVTDGDEAARLALCNYDRALWIALREAHRSFADADALRTFIEEIAAEVNKGILKTGVLYRCGADSTKKPYTCLAALEQDVRWFYGELWKRLGRVPYDAVETAAFTEYYMNLRIHMWADGCCKTSLVCGAYMLLRGGHLPARYTDRDECYGYNLPHRVACDSDEDRACYRRFLTYYRTLCN